MIPALYFTNLISARPLMGPAGAGSLAQVINAALANKERFVAMRGFFEGVGEGETSGVWQGMPVRRGTGRAGPSRFKVCLWADELIDLLARVMVFPY